MAWHPPKVEINFADLDDTENWIDVTEWVENITTSRGRSTELDRFSGGSATVILTNRDRRFDPTHTASPYYPHVKPRRKIRISVLIGITTYWLFTGYIESWPQAVDHLTGTSVVAVSCYDGFGILAQIKLRGNLYYQYLKDLNPDAWFRFNDIGDGNRTIIEELGRNSLSAYGSTVLNDETDYPQADVEGLVSFDGNTKGGLRNDDGIMDEFWDFGTITWAMKHGDRHSYAANVSSGVLNMDVTCWDMGGLMYCNLDMPAETTSGNYGRRGRVYVQLITADFVTVIAGVATDASVLDGKWHHYALTFDGTSLALYMDGIRQDTTLAWSGRAME